MKGFHRALGKGLGKPLIEPPAMVSVLGAARSGIAAAELLLDQGYDVYLSDSRRNKTLEENCRPLAERGAEISLGWHDKDVLWNSDFMVISPGIDEKIFLQPGGIFKNIPLISEVELAFWFCPVPLTAVTGTNGKSTTVTLLGKILAESGVPCRVAGNIGTALCQVVRELKDEILLVVEISSYQLHTIISFRPRLAMMINLSPDHLERYRDLTEYFSAKERLFMNMEKEDLVILNADQAETASRARKIVKPGLFWFGFDEGPDHLAFVRAGKVYLRRPGEKAKEVIKLSKIRLPGRHNVENILAATAAAGALGASAKAAARVASTFTGLPHRLEKVAEIEGVTFINDSKATTVDSVLRALESLSGPVVLIMGGRHKGSTYQPLAGQLRTRVRRIIVIGEAREIIQRELGAFCPVSLADSMEQAVEWARESALPGDTVLLSPGCSSFDMFTDYEERGDTFKSIVSGKKKNGTQAV